MTRRTRALAMLVLSFLGGCQPEPTKHVALHIQERPSLGAPCIEGAMVASVDGVSIPLSCVPPDPGSACSGCYHGTVDLPIGEHQISVNLRGQPTVVGPSDTIAVTEEGDMGPGIDRDAYLTAEVIRWQ